MAHKFDSTTAADAGRKGGKSRAAEMWKDKDPATVRNKQLKISVSQSEAEMISSKAKECGLSKAEFIIKACERANVFCSH